MHIFYRTLLKTTGFFCLFLLGIYIILLAGNMRHLKVLTTINRQTAEKLELWRYLNGTAQAPDTLDALVADLQAARQQEKNTSSRMRTVIELNPIKYPDVSRNIKGYIFPDPGEDYYQEPYRGFWEDWETVDSKGVQQLANESEFQPEGPFNPYREPLPWVAIIWLIGSIFVYSNCSQAVSATLSPYQMCAGKPQWQSAEDSNPRRAWPVLRRGWPLILLLAPIPGLVIAIVVFFRWLFQVDACGGKVTV